MSKMDRQFTRTATDLERKYGFGQKFSEVYNLIDEVQRDVTGAVDELDKSLDDEEIFNRLTNYGEAQGIYRENGKIYVNASYIKSGKISAAYIDATNLQVSAANITGTLDANKVTINNLSASSISGGTLNAGLMSVINLSASSINAGTLNLNYLTVTGTMSANRISGGSIDAEDVTIKNLMVDELYGNSIYIYDDDWDEGALLEITGASSYEGGKLGILTGAFSVEALDGDVYLDNADGMYFQIETGGEFIFGNADVRPNYDDSFTCGTSSRAWTDVYSCNDLNVTSDLNKKKDVVYGLNAYDGFFDALQPISFLFVNGSSGRRHTGLGAQDVERALESNGLSSMDFAGLVKSAKEDGEGFDYHLRYGEFIALLIEQVQALKKRVAALEGIA